MHHLFKIFRALIELDNGEKTGVWKAAVTVRRSKTNLTGAGVSVFSTGGCCSLGQSRNARRPFKRLELSTESGENREIFFRKCSCRQCTVYHSNIFFNFGFIVTVQRSGGQV